MLSLLAETKYHKHVKAFLENNTDYRYIEELGVGSYGVAYLIEHSGSHKKYVLKRMKAKHRSKEKLRQKFNLEIQLLKEIGLLNTPSVISQGEIENIPFYIMDFIEGQTFEQAIFRDGNTFSLDQSLSITKQLLEYVVILHNKGIVHRDLRIPNILFKDDQLYIIDFGLASYIDKNIQSEVIDNPKRAQNHISDLYFIGHFLLFLLYSTYTPTIKKERSWQQELQLPEPVVHYIERLLLLGEPFSSAEEALSLMPLEYASSTR
ncbi:MULTISPECIES: serine/threonine-protein kinase [Lysinibacillus]|uniref:Serine/threonine protein kinase n=1 Tax=Lysinibacillus antri TaxID=2498145 RepID=A0A3S0PN39_9BACI|nr:MULTISPECIES: protein kinase [Lysinibacillus]RUL49590.1 serine/threonine protein kinase [Lysinibacillus antri]TSI02271.1 protein kinase [Lysinibacillus sp. BW-2-10]